MPTTTGKPAVHPAPLMLFLAVVTLIVDYRIHDAAGPLAFLLASAGFGVVIGWLVGRRWRLYPWQIGVLGAIPAAAWVAWRFATQATMDESVRNLSLFIYHPLLVLITGHFGGLLGRWQALKARARASNKP